MPSQPEDRTENSIIELTDVFEEGHPDQPNLPQAASASTSNEVLDDLDLEKEIDQIFSDLGAPSTAKEVSAGTDKTAEDELDLDDLFGKAQTESGHGAERPVQGPDTATSLEEHEDGLQELVENGADVGDDAHPAMEQDESPAQDELQNLSAPDQEPAGSMADQGQTPQAALRTPQGAEELSALQERLAIMEEKIAALPDLDQLIARQVDQRLEAFGQEASAAQKEQITALRQELETAWEQKAAEMIEGGLDTVQSRHQEALAQTLAAHKEELTALLDSRLQELQPTGDQEDQDRALETVQALQEQWQSFQEQAEAKLKQNAEDFSATLEQLRADLLQELQAAIPGAAARIIREEIQALTEE